MRTSVALLKTYLLIGLTSLFFAACASGQPPSLEERMSENSQGNEETMPAEDTLSYKLKGVEATVSTSQSSFGFNALQLAAMASSCGKDQAQDHFQELVKQFESANAKRTIYTFDYSGESQNTGVYQVFLLPNTPGYDSMKAFEADFKSCQPSARMNPALVNENWLLFTTMCLPAKEDSQLPDGCSEIKAVVDGTFELK